MDIYHQPEHPAAFGGRDVFRKAAKLTSAKAQKLLLSDKTYRKYKRPKVKFERARVFVSSIGHQFQADLMDLQKFAHLNKGYNYLLIVVDAFSRLTLARPLKRKTGPQVASALHDVFSELKGKDLLGEQVLLATDLGTEFWNSHTKQVFKDFSISHFALRAPKKCSFAENAGRYLLDRMYKYMHKSGENKWFDRLDDFVAAKNSRKNRSLGDIAPKDVNFANQASIYRRLYIDKKQTVEKSPLKVGQKVQLSLDRLPFHKSFHGYFSQKVYIIKHRINYNGIYRYTLIDSDDNVEISGTYYAKELLPFPE
jgi:transposase InsO family protein